MWKSIRRTGCKSELTRRSKPSIAQQYESYLHHTFDVLSKVYGISPLKDTVPSLSDVPCCVAVRMTKEVLSGPLDSYLSGKPSGLPLVGLKKRDEGAALASLHSFKKGLPEPCKCVLSKMEETFIKRSQEEMPLPAGYLRFAKKITASLFKRGWDNGYNERVESNSCALAASAEAPRSHLGAYGVLGKERLDRISMGKECIPTYVCKLSTIMSDGKPRVLVKTPATWQALRPLHSLMYDHLSKTDWLLRGEPSLSHVEAVWKGMGRDEMFLSGDYESSTDYLSISVAETILKTIRTTSRHIPDPLWEAAINSLRPIIETKDGKTYHLKRGQMMGSLLSFPLLCLQNYIATRYVLGDRPMKINGDDLLTRCTKAEYEKWTNVLPTLGLVPSKGKCGFRRSFFTINSEYFQIVRSRVRRAHTFKGRGFTRSDEGVPLGSAMSKHRGHLRGEMKERFERVYIGTHAKSICASRRSLRALGWSVSASSVPRWCAVREWSLQGDHERPLPPAPEKHNLCSIPEGFGLRPRKEVKSRLPDPTFQLVEKKQGSFWSEGKDFQRDGAKSIKRQWCDWWADVRMTGILPPRWSPRLRVSVSLDPYYENQEGHWNMNINQYATRRMWGDRLKSNEIGVSLRRLQDNRRGNKEDLILVPLSLLRRSRFISFVKRETVGNVAK